MLSKRNMTTAACTVALVATVALAETPTARRNAAATATLSLTGGGSASAGNGATTAVTMEESGDDWDISGPIFMRSATPEPPGELIIKNNFGWARHRGDADEYEYELVLEYGLMPEHELILELPIELGEGRIDGNGDVELGWHWRFLKESGDMPAFAMRNIIRIPTGVDSSGVDYIWRGLVTKTITPGKSRLHFNPFLKSVNGNNGEAENFQWGAAIGMDYRLRDDLLMTWDYLWTGKEVDGGEDNHALELGLEWDFAEDEILAVSTEIGLDGNDEGTQFGVKISYMIEIDVD